MIYHLIVYIYPVVLLWLKTTQMYLLMYTEGDDGTHMFIYENGVEKIDPFLYTFGKY